MDRVFLDANVLFSAAYRSDAGLTKLWKLKVELITSAYALEEAMTNLESDDQRDRLNRLIADVQVIPVYMSQALPETLKLPQKDQPIMRAAIAAGATHLLTGDVTHFGRYYGKSFGGALILPPGDYLRLHTK